jgi:hypothetical protein
LNGFGASKALNGVYLKGGKMSGFTSFLKQFGLEVVKAAEGIIGSPKLIIQTIAQDSADVRSLINMVKMGEGMWAAAGIQKAGSQKLAAVTPFVAAMVGDVEVIAGTKLASIIKDQTQFNSGVQDLISAMVKILNACGD